MPTPDSWRGEAERLRQIHSPGVDTCACGDPAVPEMDELVCQHPGYCCWCGSEQPAPMYCDFYEVPSPHLPEGQP